MTTMKAVRIHAYGGPEKVRYEDAPRPSAGPGEVLVRVHAAGVNPVDWKVREGLLQDALRYPLPMIPGWDVSGTIAELGAGVTELAVGDEVYGFPDISRDGVYAEYAVIRAKELAKKPRRLDHAHAAAVPLAALTAWQALFEAHAPYTSAGLREGQTLLVHGAAGGVGTFAVQLAKARGARVVATGSARNADFLAGLGADRVIDYTAEAFEDVLRDVDVVFDTVGGDTQDRSWRVLRKGGTLVSIVTPPSEEAARAHGARAAYVFVQPDARQLEEIARLLDAGRLAPVLAAQLPLAEAREALAMSQGRHVRGKIVLRVD